LGVDRSEVYAMSGEVPDAGRTPAETQAAERAAAQADRAQRAAQNATQSVEDVKESTVDVIKALDVKVGAATENWRAWQHGPRLGAQDSEHRHRAATCARRA
jgi:hypothetical protein